MGKNFELFCTVNLKTNKQTKQQNDTKTVLKLDSLYLGAVVVLLNIISFLYVAFYSLFINLSNLQHSERLVEGQTENMLATMVELIQVDSCLVNLQGCLEHLLPTVRGNLFQYSLS